MAEPKCPVCKGDYTAPKILPCAQVICRECLLSWLHKDTHKSCPVCRTTVVPTNSEEENCDLQIIVDNLLDDYGTVAVLQSRKILQAPRVCEICDEEENTCATSFCFNCSKKLCSTCTKHHAKFRDTKHHLINSFGELTVERLAENSHVTCQLHSDRVVEFYCPAHGAVMCAECLAGHGGCGEKKEKVEEVVGGERKKLKNQADRLMNCGSALTNKVSYLEQQLHQGKEGFLAASDTIKHQFQELQEALNRRCQQLLDKVHKEQEDFLTSATSELTPLRELNSVVTTHGRTVDRLATNTPGAHLLKMVAKLQPRLKELENKSAEFCPEDDVRSCSNDSELHTVEETITSRTSTDDVFDSSRDELDQSQNCADTSTPSTLPKTSTGAEAMSTQTSDSSTRRKVDDDVLNRKAISKVRCLARDLGLDDERVDMVKNMIASLDCQSSTAESMTASGLADPFSEKTVQRMRDPCQDDLTTADFGASATGYYSCAEDGTVSDVKPRSSITLKKSFFEHENSAEKTIQPTSQAPSVKFMSSSVPSGLLIPNDRLAAKTDARMCFDDIIVASSDQAVNQNRLSAISGFIATYVTRRLDDQPTSKQGADSDGVKPKEEDDPSDDLSLTQTTSNPGRKLKIQAPGLLEFSFDSARDNWTNDSLEAAASQRRRSKSSGDVPLASRGFGEVETTWTSSSHGDDLIFDPESQTFVKQKLELAGSPGHFAILQKGHSKEDTVLDSDSSNGMEGKALVNTGFTALSSSNSEAVHLVEVGSRVMRGRHWSRFQKNVDGGAGGSGKVMKKGKGNHMFGEGWVLVLWNTGWRKWHRMGAEDCFDLILC
ncbi:hypothetical protein ACOMHN_044390 [Nucella lapillus]